MRKQDAADAEDARRQRIVDDEYAQARSRIHAVRMENRKKNKELQESVNWKEEGF